MNPLIVGSIFDLGSKMIDKFFSSPEDKARAQMQLLEMQQKGELDQMQVSMSAILAEANSADPWTSRARPSFMYVFYAVILSMSVVAPALGVFFPDQMALFFSNVGMGFGAIPEELWYTFGIGYLGYAGARSYEKKKGVAR